MSQLPPWMFYGFPALLFLEGARSSVWLFGAPPLGPVAWVSEGVSFTRLLSRTTSTIESFTLHCSVVQVWGCIPSRHKSKEIENKFNKYKTKSVSRVSNICRAAVEQLIYLLVSRSMFQYSPGENTKPEKPTLKTAPHRVFPMAPLDWSQRGQVTGPQDCPNRSSRSRDIGV